LLIPQPADPFTSIGNSGLLHHSVSCRVNALQPTAVSKD
jgi:hypothetical protein